MILLCLSFSSSSRIRPPPLGSASESYSRALLKKKENCTDAEADRCED
jgi:hypothetical protein